MSGAPGGAGGGAGGAAQPGVPDWIETGWHPGHNPWAVALTVTLATFMEILDTAIANVSLRHIAGSLSVGEDEATWVLTSYLVSNAIILPISGWASNRIGRKRFYMTCVAIFTVSSLLCGLAPNLGMLIFFRVVQGLGGGGLAPSEQAILADTFPPRKRGMAFAMFGMAVVLAPAIGPTLGGYITDHFSWRWVFFINVPVGILSLFLTSRMVVDPPHITAARGKAGKVDFLGLGLIALGLGTLEVVLDKGQQEDWFASSFIVTFSAIALVSLVVFVVWEWRHENPIVDVRLFKDRNFAAANTMMFMLGLALFGSTVLLPAFLQSMMGYTAELSGMALSPGGMVVICLMPLVGRMVSRVDPRYMIAFGFTVLSGSLFHMAHTLSLTMDFQTAMSLRMIQSVGLAFLFVPINTIVYNGVPPQRNNAVAGIVNLSRNLGADVGIAMVTTLIARRAQVHQVMLSEHASLFDPVFRERLELITRRLVSLGHSAVDASHEAQAALYRVLVQQSVSLAYVDTVWILAIGTVFMVPLVFLTRRTRPGGAPAGGH